MTVATFEHASNEGLKGVLLAQWWEAKGDRKQAHEVAQEVQGADGA